MQMLMVNNPAASNDRLPHRLSFASSLDSLSVAESPTAMLPNSDLLNNAASDRVREHLTPAIIGMGCILGAVGNPTLSLNGSTIAVAQGKRPILSSLFLGRTSKRGSTASSMGSISPVTAHTPALASRRESATGSAVSGQSRKSVGSWFIGRVKQVGQQHQKPAIASPSLEELHKGDAFSFGRYLAKTGSIENFKASPTGTIRSRTGPDRPHSIDLDAFASVLEQPTSNDTTPFSGMNGDHIPTSSRFSVVDRVRRESRELSSTPVSDDVKKAQRSLADKHYFHSEMQFVSALMSVSMRLVHVPREARQSSLKAELALLNHNLPARVCIPLWCMATHEYPYHHQLVRIAPDEAVVLNSADRVSFSG
jgi:phosphatidylinositol 4-kinase